LSYGATFRCLWIFASSLHSAEMWNYCFYQKVIRLYVTSSVALVRDAKQGRCVPVSQEMRSNR
jgi:hypothetical protein